MDNLCDDNNYEQTLSDDVFYIISKYSKNINNISLLNKQIRDITHNYKVFNAGKLTVDFLNKKGKLIRKITNYRNQFNLSIVPNLTHLKMGYDFNQQITLPNSLTHLEMGYTFNQQIILPNSLVHLLKGYKNYIIKKIID